MQELQRCTLCPRACAVNRVQAKHGFCCVTGTHAKVARVGLHLWEEPCISGKNGSGTVFFYGCNLRCSFCQNHTISTRDGGAPYTVEQLAQAYLSLQQQGAHNINLVTATHYIPQLTSSLRLAKQSGLTIPVVYNCVGYESVDSLKRLHGLVDLYLPDFKFWDSITAKELANAPDYPQVVRAALHEMVEQTGDFCIGQDGLAQKGVLVRHLVLPQKTRQAKQILSYLSRTYGNRIGYSILRQYTPMPGAKGALARPLLATEYETVVDHADSLALTYAYIQEADSVGEQYIPDFE